MCFQPHHECVDALAAVGMPCVANSPYALIRTTASMVVLFVIHLKTRRVEIAGITEHPNAQRMKQVARNPTMNGIGFSPPLRQHVPHPGQRRDLPALLQ